MESPLCMSDPRKAEAFKGSVMPHKVQNMGIGPQITCGMPHENVPGVKGVCLTDMYTLQLCSLAEWPRYASGEVRWHE